MSLILDRTKRMSIDGLLIVLERQDTQIKDLQEELKRREQYFQEQIETKRN